MYILHGNLYYKRRYDYIMNKFIEIKPEELEKSTFRLIGKEWMLITAEKDRISNANLTK